MEPPSAPLVVHLVHSLDGGGTERVLVSLLRAFNHHAVRHAVVTLRDAGSLAADLPDDVACIALDASGRCRTSGIRLAGILARLRPTLIHARNVCTWCDAVVARVLCHGPKLVLGFHGLESGGPFSQRDRWTAWAASALDASFTSVSESGRRKMARELRLPVHRIQFLPNGIDLTQFGNGSLAVRNEVRDSFGFQLSDRVIGIVGSLTRVKGHGVLIEAVAMAAEKSPHVRLLVVGDGALRNDLERIAGKFGIRDRVRFAGWQDDIPSVLSALDAYVCASHSEGMSNSVMEAMASALPVVSTAVGDHPVIVRHGVDGLIVPPNDVTALADAIETMVSSPEPATSMGRSARARIENSSFERTVDSYQRFYQRLIEQNPGHAHTFASICRRVSKSVTCAQTPRVIPGASVK